MAPSQRTWALERLYWEDLWAPLRFAVPATHPVEVECTTAHLEGDATLLAVGRMGPTYRKTLQGRDVVVKVLAYCVPRDLDGEAGVMPTRLRGELQREVEAYDRLEDLWGVVVPHMLWFGSIVDDMADALATEYVGGPMSRTVTPSLVESAIQALKAIHARGVLHGDAEVKNFCVRPEDGRVFVVDLGMAKFREEFKTKAEWDARVRAEVEALRGELRRQAAASGGGVGAAAAARRLHRLRC